jgi:hypothetical protein
LTKEVFSSRNILTKRLQINRSFISNKVECVVDPDLERVAFGDFACDRRLDERWKDISREGRRP